MLNKNNFLLGISFLLISCTNTNISKNRVDIQELSKLVFNGYKYEYKPGIVKSSAEMSNIVISKSAMSKSDFINVEKKIIQNGWVKKYDYQGFNVYCYGVYNKLGVLYPEKMEYFDKDGGAIKISNFNNWLIYYVYSNSGVDGCD